MDKLIGVVQAMNKMVIILLIIEYSIRGNKFLYYLICLRDHLRLSPRSGVAAEVMWGRRNWIYIDNDKE